MTSTFTPEGSPSQWLVELIAPKVYVHDERGVCRARLCTISAEYILEDPLIVDTARSLAVRDSTFEQFQEKCLELWGLVITDNMRPRWAVAPT